MKIRKTEIERAVPKNDIRTYMNAPYADIERGYIYATTGYVAARVPIIVEDGDASGHIPIKALQESRKLSGRGKNAAEYAEIHANGACALADGSSLPRPDLGAVPAALTDKIDQWMSTDAKPEIWFSADYLIDLARAITKSGEPMGIGLAFEHAPDGTIDPQGLIRVFAIGDCDEPDKLQARGLLMPMRGK